MRVIAKISPSIKLTARLSCNTNIRRYTSLVQVLQSQTNDQNLLWSNYALRRFNATNSSEFNKAFKYTSLEISQDNRLKDLHLLRSNSSKVLLIPLNWQEVDEHTMGNGITSIFSKPKNQQQIEVFHQVIRDVSDFQKAKQKVPQKSKSKKSIEPKNLPNTQKENLNLKDLKLAKNKNVFAVSQDFFDYLASAMYKNLQHDSLLGERSKGLKMLPIPFKGEISKVKDASTLNLKEISWNPKLFFPFKIFQKSSLTNITFPLSLLKKSYSTKSTNLTQQQLLLESQGQNSDIFSTLPKTSSQKVVTLRIRRTASSGNSQSKCNPNYDFPFLSKLFGTKELLMSCDAYNQALVEAAKRRAALAECAALSKKLINDANSRPKVINIKGCSAPKPDTHNALQPAPQASSPCPPPQKPKQQASDGCKKDDPCKPAECPNPCKDEMEKLKRQKDEEMKRNRNTMPTGCESPKCKKDDNCTKLHKSPCKKASESHSPIKLDKQHANKSSSPYPSPPKPKQQASGGCKKDDPCNPPECPNPCKDEIEKLKRQKDEEMKRNRNKMPTGCVSPKCKKEDPCNKRKENPCKKASDCSKGPSGSQESLKCDKKSGGNKGKPDSPEKSKDKKQNPCLDEHKEHEPKCNVDPCKQNKAPCGGAKKTSDGPSASKKADSRESGKKEDPCKKDKKKENPCKEENQKSPCGGSKQKQEPCKKKDSDPCGKKNEDPCKKRKSSPCSSKKEDPCKKQKEDPCKKKKDGPCGSKQKEDPCKKKEDSCKKQKEDPCIKKKNGPCGSKQKEDPCKKKEDSCKKQKEDPCKKKKQPTSPCGSKKEDPCKKDKDDPCKNKKSSPCVSGKKKDDLCSKKPTSPCKSKSDFKKQGCGTPKRETKPNCRQNTKRFSTLAIMSDNSLIKRTLTNYGFMRHYSSDKKKDSEDLGKSSQCKSVLTNVPHQRKPAYNPHPKEGLRKCYPTYDMDCKKLCKDARKTDCKKYAFLKDTDNNKRNGKK